MRIVVIIIVVSCCAFVDNLYGKVIEFRGSAKWLKANDNTVENIKSEIESFKTRNDFPQAGILKFTSPQIVLDEGDGDLRENLIPVVSNTVFYKFRATTPEEAIEKKMMLLTAYITLRFNGMTAFNSCRVVFEMTKSWKILRPEDTVQIPVSLLEHIDDVPDWINRYYLNKDSDIGKEKNLYSILRLIDGDIIWLFVDKRGNAELICGYDGRHRSLSGFQEVFNSALGRRGFSGTLSRVESEMIAKDIWEGWGLRWLSPLEITSLFE